MPNLKKITIAEFLKMLRVRDFITMIILIATIVTGAFTAGYRYSKDIHSKSGSCVPKNCDLEIVFTANGLFQKEYQKEEYIREFKAFLDDVAANNWYSAYSRTSNTWRETRDFSNEEGLKYGFRMTKRHQYNYFIPVEINENRAKFIVDLGYEDYFPDYKIRNEIRDAFATEVINHDWLNKMIDHLTIELGNHYKTTNYSNEQLKKIVSEEVKSKKSVELLFGDAIIEDIGRYEKLDPIFPEDFTQDKRRSEERRRLCNVEMVKERGSWKIVMYDSFLIEENHFN